MICPHPREDQQFGRPCTRGKDASTLPVFDLWPPAGRALQETVSFLLPGFLGQLMDGQWELNAVSLPNNFLSVI